MVAQSFRMTPGCKIDDSNSKASDILSTHNRIPIGTIEIPSQVSEHDIVFKRTSTGASENLITSASVRKSIEKPAAINYFDLPGKSKQLEEEKVKGKQDIDDDVISTGSR